MTDEYTVIKRTGLREVADLNKITIRLTKLWKLGKFKAITRAHITDIAIGVFKKLSDGVHISVFDEEAARLAANMEYLHPEFGRFAAMIAINNHQKNTYDMRSMLALTTALYRNSADGKPTPLVSREYYKFVDRHHDALDAMIKDNGGFDKDYAYSIAGFRVLEKSYLLRLSSGRIVEGIQHMLMRVAIGIWRSRGDEDDEVALKQIRASYELFSVRRSGTHATPALFNAGTPKEQYISCFLKGVDDSRESIMKLADDCSQTSKWSGGIGFWLHSLRAQGSHIHGTNGKSSGPVPFTQLLAQVSKAFNQGGKRPGSFAHYISLEHPDALDLLSMRNSRRDSDMYNRQCYIGAWVPDLFWVRVLKDEMWSFFDPALTARDDGKKLYELWGDEYEAWYCTLESKNIATKSIKARAVLEEIARLQIETGFPYILHADRANGTSNQQNLGKIQSSNLCTEIIEYSSPSEYACCVLASLCLPSFVRDEEGKKTFDFETLARDAQQLTRNLNRIVDINQYPVLESQLSNFRHRPLGLGVQGLADVYHMMELPFDSPGASALNLMIFETIYYASISESCNLAREQYLKYKKRLDADGSVFIPTNYEICYELDEKKQPRASVQPILTKYETLPTDCGAYTSYKGSPISKGIFHFELSARDNERFAAMMKRHGLEVTRSNPTISKRWDWESLRAKIAKFGVRNSLNVALMPTASTASIMGNSSSFEPYARNVYIRAQLSGSHTVVNPYLVQALSKEEKWSKEMSDKLIQYGGSVQELDISLETKQQFKTAYELSQKVIMEQAEQRGWFVDQAQSMNLFVSNPTVKKVCAILIDGWKRGLITGLYYLRAESQKSQVSYVGLKRIRSTEVVEASKKTFVQDDEEGTCLGCEG